MRLEPLYRIRFMYPEQWGISLGGDWEQHFAIAEGRCEGEVSGRFRGANYPRRRGDGTFRPDFRAVIETEDGATIMFEWHGYGRAYPVGRRQIVGAVFHLSDDERYRRLNDVVCVCVGEVRAREEAPSDLVVDVAELIWEPIDEIGAPLPPQGRGTSAARVFRNVTRGHAPLVSFGETAHAF